MNERVVTIESVLEQQDFVRGLARRLLQDDDLAEDVVQQTLLAALKNPPRCREYLRTWLRRVVRNYVFQYRRAGARRHHHESTAAIDPRRQVPSTDEIVERESTRRMILEAVLELDAPFRDVIILRYLENLSLPEVAERIDRPLETARSRLKRGVQILRQKLTMRTGGDQGMLFSALLPLAIDPRTGRLPPPGEGGDLARPESAPSPPLLLRIPLLLTLLGVIAATLLWVPPWDRWSRAPAGPEPAARTRSATGPTFPEVIPARREKVAADRTDRPPRNERRPIHARSLSLAGSILDAAGAPVPGAKVYYGNPDNTWAFYSEQEFRRFIGTLARDPDAAGGSTWHSTQSDEDGRYVFVMNEECFSWTVAAVHPDEGIRIQTGVSILGRQPTLCDLHLEPGVVLRGTVSDATGAVVASARVSVWEHRVEDGVTLRQPVARVSTDAEGQFRTWPLAGESFTVEVAAAGFRSQMLGPLPVAAEAEQVLAIDPLQPSTRARGRIAGPAGGLGGLLSRLARLPGDAGLRVFLLDRDPSEPASGSLEEVLPGDVDLRRGEYSFALEKPLLPPSHVVLLGGDVLLTYAAVERGGVCPPLTLDPDRLDALLSNGRLQVQVLDAASRQPLEAITARASRLIPFPATGVQGHFTLSTPSPAGTAEAELVAGEYLVSVRAPGYVPADQVVRVEAGRVTSATAEMHAGGRPVAIRLQRHDGSPVLRARLLLLREDGTPVTPGSIGRSGELNTRARDTRGTFRLGVAAPGRYRLKVLPLVTAEPQGDLPTTTFDLDLNQRWEEVPVVRLPEPAIVRLEPHVRRAGSLALRLWDSDGVLVRDDLQSGLRHESGAMICRLGVGLYHAVVQCDDGAHAEFPFEVRDSGRIGFPWKASSLR